MVKLYARCRAIACYGSLHCLLRGNSSSRKFSDCQIYKLLMIGNPIPIDSSKHRNICTLHEWLTFLLCRNHLPPPKKKEITCEKTQGKTV